jgi:methylenetetrahydrofolate reductase (NADPH)
MRIERPHESGQEDRAQEGLRPGRGRVTPAAEARLVELLARPRYEVIPLDGVEDEVLAHVPGQITVTVTVSPSKGLEPTLDLAERLVKRGYEVVPHLSARLVKDDGHLRDIVARIVGLGLRDVFVVAGDAERAAGPFHGGAALLRAMAQLDESPEQVGITGYPESHPIISVEETIEAMFEKAEFATYITSQMCFDAAVTCDWVDAVWRRGTRLPIHIGIPGVVHATKLLRISARIGLGDSTRFLRKQRSLVRRLLLPRAYRPDHLIRGLDRCLTDPERKVGGFHVFTFNELEETERWRREWLERLASAAAAPAA